MTAWRELPIAPRPQDDELLSSWQGRVACRYDLAPDDLSRWLGVLDDGRRAGFAERDFAPSAEAVQAWAAACRLSEDGIRGLALLSRPRSHSWYVWGEGREVGAFRWPVCPVCLHADAAAGRDHYFRRSWVLVETLICDRHDRPLEEACLYCLDSSGFRFVVCEPAARLACVSCGRLVEAARQLRRTGSGDLFGSVSMSIAKAIADQPAMAERVMRVARLLWSPPRPRTGRRTPFVADVLPDLRLSPSVETWVDRTEPLATAPLGWRRVTLLGVVQLLGLEGPWESLGRLPFTIEQIEEWIEQRRPPPREKAARASDSAAPGGLLSSRSDADYLALARSILASAEWRAVQGGDLRAKRQTLGVLIDTALGWPRGPRPHRPSPTGRAMRKTASETAAAAPDPTPLLVVPPDLGR